jgi:tetratricopeptide (TPR) repeat protein
MRSSFVILLVLIANSILSQTPLKGRDTTINGPQTFAMIVGISKYKYVRPLAYADKDAEMFRDYLRSPGGGSVKNDNIFCLLNEDAICSNFWAKGFQWLKAKQLQAGDRLFIYLAGHGDAIDEDQFFFLGYDCNPAGDKNNYLAGGAIQLFNLKKKIAAETAKGVEVFFIMDACRTSELPGGLPGLNFLNTAITEKKAGEIIMLATAAGQESLEHASIGNGHGLFTYYLVDGLAGSADSLRPDKKIDFAEIQRYISNNVPLIAQQQFKRDQRPYFCCSEFNQKIVGLVDTAYLNNWLRLKRLQRGRTGNSFYENFKRPIKIDTSITRLYNDFNNAVKNKKITGGGSAEYFYDELQRRFPQDPHTLDARSTIANEFIKDAQAKVDRFISCGSVNNENEKNDFANAGNRLQKAIDIINEYDADYAATLNANMYLLKSLSNISSFQNAYAALASSPNAAYINNRLAAMHIENNRPDSAIYYARRAIGRAPNWKCAYATLAQAYQLMNITDSVKKYNQLAADPSKAFEEKKPNQQQVKKTSFKPGIVIGTGSSKLKPVFTQRGTQNIVDVSGSNAVKLDLGLTGRIQLSASLSLRPDVILSFDGPTLNFFRRNVSGGIDTERVKVEYISMNFALPLVINMGASKVSPYFSLAPNFGYIIGTNRETDIILPLNKAFLTADIALGVDINFATFVLSPQIGYSNGLNNMKKEASSEYSMALSSLKPQAYTLKFYFRKK